MRKLQPRLSHVCARMIDTLFMFALASLLAVSLLILAKPARVSAEVLCADDIVPLGMAVTATGTAPSCDGSCRAREIKPVCGLVMKICAGQPMPRLRRRRLRDSLHGSRWSSGAPVVQQPSAGR